MRERKRTRLEGFDYSTDNLCFITACVQDRICCLGDINNGSMILNKYGEIAHNQFIWLQKQYEYVHVHEFVVMPDHVHAVIEINWNLICNGVGIGRDLSLQEPLKIKSLSELVGAYKTTVSKQIHLVGLDRFSWQKSFHDRIIRNEIEYGRIVKYISENPMNWKSNELKDILSDD